MKASCNGSFEKYPIPGAQASFVTLNRIQHILVNPFDTIESFCKDQKVMVCNKLVKIFKNKIQE